MKSMIIVGALIGILGGSTATVNSLNNFQIHHTSVIETQGFGSSEVCLSITDVTVQDSIDEKYSRWTREHDGINEDGTLNEDYKFVVLSLDISSKDDIDATMNCIRLGKSRLSCDEEPVYSDIDCNNVHDGFKLSLTNGESKSCKIGFLVKNDVIESDELILKWNPNDISFDENIRYISLDV